LNQLIVALIIYDYVLDNNMVPMLHIYYCNDAHRRNWIKIKQIIKFSSKEEILAENPKLLVSQYFLNINNLLL